MTVSIGYRLVVRKEDKRNYIDSTLFSGLEFSKKISGMENLDSTRFRALSEWTQARKDVSRLEEDLKKKREKVKELERNHAFLGNIKGMISKRAKKKPEERKSKKDSSGDGGAGTSKGGGGSAKKRKADDSQARKAPIAPPSSASAMRPPQVGVRRLSSTSEPGDKFARDILKQVKGSPELLRALGDAVRREERAGGRSREPSAEASTVGSESGDTMFTE